MATVFKSMQKHKRRREEDAESSDSDSGSDTRPTKAVATTSVATNGTSKTEASKPPQNRQRVLLLSSRGVTYRHRHLLSDLHAMLPHGRKEAKLDTKTQLYMLNELAELYACNNVMFFEARKGQDLYVWLSKPPNGPTVKMYMENLHTMEELHFPGNCLRGSRPILSFSSDFSSANPHLLVIKELLSHSFGVPPGARKSKPFIDHVMGFTWADGRVWIRVYEIKETALAKGEKTGSSDASKPTTSAAADPNTPPSAISTLAGQGAQPSRVSLVEIGPRFVLTPIIIQQGSFGGPIIYENRRFVSPNQVRADLRRAKSAKFAARQDAGAARNVKERDLGLKTGGPKRKTGGKWGEELDDGKLFG